MIFELRIMKLRGVIRKGGDVKMGRNRDYYILLNAFSHQIDNSQQKFYLLTSVGSSSKMV